MKLSAIRALLAATLAVTVVRAQQIGTSQPEVHPALPSQTCTLGSGCATESTKIVLDANWRWTHKVGDYTNCYTGNKWDAVLCADPATCAKGCALEGANYSGTYGISTSGTELSLKLVTRGQYGSNIGSRVYLMQDDTKYKLFKLLNKEFTFDVDVSQLPCGLNGALYFVQMDEDGGKSKYTDNKAGAAYGTGYCDAQCPRDIKFINGEANVLDWTPSGSDQNSGGGRYGACCMEMDIWESNSISNAYTSHPCTFDGLFRCASDTECGTGAGNRYRGSCDKDGCDFNPHRLGDKTFYGPGASFQIDTTKPFTVITQFITSDETETGDLVEIKRFFKQNGKVVENAKINIAGIDPLQSLTEPMCSQTKKVFGDPDDHTAKGGLKQMGKALQKGVVLAMSLWTDHEAHCLWLDSSYPLNRSPTEPGVARGSCPITSGKPAEVETQYPESTVKYSNIRVGDIDSTYQV
ncbi:putative glycosyl hydrolase family 7 protein, partial [Globisporangium splendens]